MRIIYCYQNPVLLDHIKSDPKLVDVINVGTFQFKYKASTESTKSIETEPKTEPNTEPESKPEPNAEPESKPKPEANPKQNIDMLFNDLQLQDPMTQKMWAETKKVGNLGIDIILVLGGDRTYDILFQDFGVCYPLLTAIIREKYWITGIDLKIFGWVHYSDIIPFIKLLKKDFGVNFKVTLTVPAYALQKPHERLSSFPYDTLYDRIGTLISWYNVESYWNYCFKTYDKIIKNGYDASAIVFCMDARFFEGKTGFKEVIKTVRQIKIEHPTMCGTSVSEYYNAPPGPTPIRWAELMFYLVK